MSNSKPVINLSGGYVSLLGVLFVGLKLTGYITWSWWLVTLPFWAPLMIFLGFIFVALVLAAIVGVNKRG